MTLDQLRYFLAAAKFQHVGKAGKAVRISPSAVSSAVSALEAELGCKLFTRENKRIQLTNSGKQLVKRAEALLGEVGSLARDFSSPHSSLEGSFRLGGSHFLARHYLTPAWVRMQKKNPALAGEICALSTADAIREILQGTLDFALCFSPLKHPDLEEKILFRGQLLLATSKKHPLAKKTERLPWKHLSTFPAVLHKAAPGVDLCENHSNFEKYLIRPNTRLMFDDDGIALACLKETYSWALLPDLVLRNASGIRALKHPPGWKAPFHVSLLRKKTPALDSVGLPLEAALRNLF